MPIADVIDTEGSILRMWCLCKPFSQQKWSFRFIDALSLVKGIHQLQIVQVNLSQTKHFSNQLREFTRLFAIRYHKNTTEPILCDKLHFYQIGLNRFQHHQSVSIVLSVATRLIWRRRFLVWVHYEIATIRSLPRPSSQNYNDNMFVAQAQDVRGLLYSNTYILHTFPAWIKKIACPIKCGIKLLLNRYFNECTIEVENG